MKIYQADSNLFFGDIKKKAIFLKDSPELDRIEKCRNQPEQFGSS